MGITKDAGELLVYIYREYVNSHKHPTKEELIKITQWPEDKLDRAINFLVDDELISLRRYFYAESFSITRPTPKAIKIIEDEKTFENTFGFAMNLGVFTLSWNRKEKP